MNTARIVRAEKPVVCPACGGSPVARILYGMPIFSEELKTALDEGTVVLGSCVISGDDPKWQCTQCNEYIYDHPAPARNDTPSASEQ